MREKESRKNWSEMIRCLLVVGWLMGCQVKVKDEDFEGGRGGVENEKER